jgi:hypothetical protein
MDENYWGKVYKEDYLLYNFVAEIYHNEEIEDQSFIAKQVMRKRFFSADRALSWVEKKILNEQKSFIIKDSDILKRGKNE